MSNKQVGHICRVCSDMEGTAFCCIMLDLCPHKVWFEPVQDPCDHCEWKPLRVAELQSLLKKVK